jgi:hypothetical protein
VTIATLFPAKRLLSPWFSARTSDRESLARTVENIIASLTGESAVGARTKKFKEEHDHDLCGRLCDLSAQSRLFFAFYFCLVR